MKKISFNHQYPAVTLIELLLVMAILPLLLIVVSQMFGTFMDSQERAMAQAAINQEQQYLLDKIAYDIDQSSAIVLPAADAATGSALRLQQGASTVDYAPSAVTLIRSSTAGSAPVTSTRVLLNAFTVRHFSNGNGKDSVSIGFALASTASARLGMTSRTVNTTFTLR